MIDAAKLPYDQQFKLGNFSGCNSDGQSPVDRCALMLMGVSGLRGGSLSGDTPEERFCHGVAAWIEGNEAVAIQMLEQVKTEHADRLLKLIQKPRISVMLQLPGMLGDCLPFDPKFDCHQFPLTSKTVASFDVDFGLVGPLEEVYLRLMMKDMKFPMVGMVHNFASHSSAVLPWLSVFRDVIVPSSFEWARVTNAAKTRVATFPKAETIHMPLPFLVREYRDIDVLVPALEADPMEPIISTLMSESFRLENARVARCVILSGEYARYLNRSKVTWASGSGPRGTRHALYALAMGCAVVVPVDSPLRLYFSEAEGLFTYSSPAELHERMEWIVAHWRDVEIQAARGAFIARDEWCMHKTSTQVLRFAAFLATRPHEGAAAAAPKYLPERDTKVLARFLPNYDERLARRNDKFADMKIDLRTATTPHHLLDTANTVAVDYVRSIHPPALRQLEGGRFDHRDLPITLQMYDLVAGRFTNSLVTRFNKIRMGLHFGSGLMIQEVIKLTNETLSTPENSWMIDPGEDFLPTDFFPMYFNYLLQREVSLYGMVTGADVRGILIRLVYASLHSYLGHYVSSLENFAKAVEYDPDFPTYQLFYARELSKQKDPASIQKAAQILGKLSQGSTVFIDAMESLEELRRRPGLGVQIGLSDDFQKILSAYKRSCPPDGEFLWQAFPPSPLHSTAGGEFSSTDNLTR